MQGHLAAVGTYTTRHPFGSPAGRLARNILALAKPRSSGIYLLPVDRVGRLGQPRLGAKIRNPSWLVRHPKVDVVYAASEVRSGEVRAYRVEGDVLELVGARNSGGSAPCFVAVDDVGTFLYVANYGSGTVTRMPLRTDGRFAEGGDTRRQSGSGPDRARQASAHPHCVAVSPDRKWALVPDLGADRIFIYAVEPPSGFLAANPPFTAVRPGAGPRHLVFRPDGRLALLINELSSTLSSYHFDGRTGALDQVDEVSTVPADSGRPSTAADVRFHTGGGFAFVSNRGYDSIASVAVDPAGKLEVAGITPTSGRTPRGIAVSSSGAFLLAAHQDSDEVISFAIDRYSGMLTEASRAHVPTCASVQFL